MVRSPANILSPRHLQDVFKTCLQDIFKTCPQDVCKTCLQDVLKTNKCLLGIIRSSFMLEVNHVFVEEEDNPYSCYS